LEIQPAALIPQIFFIEVFLTGQLRQLRDPNDVLQCSKQEKQKSTKFSELPCCQYDS